MIIQFNENAKYSLKVLLAIINSRLSNYYYTQLSQETGRAFAQVKPQVIRKLRVPNEILEQDRIEILVDKMEEASKKFLLLLGSFIDFVLNKLNVSSSKFTYWHNLTSVEFLKELQKTKVKITLNEEADWLKYFEEQKAKAKILNQEINKIDKEIDVIVYKLYNLTEEEIKIVEG